MNQSPHHWKEARRLQAWHLKQQGWSQRQIAEALGVSDGAVSQGMTRAREGGPDALRHRPPPGARRRLSAEQLARPQQGAPAQGHSLFFIDESGFYPWPSVVRTDAPVGQTPVSHEWWTHDHLSAIRAMSAAGKLYCHGQDCSLNSTDVVAFLAPLRREVPGQMRLLWDEAPMHRSPRLKECLANGAAHRIHRERLPAYAPELNPAEGLWAQRKGVERRTLCGFNIPHLRKERRDAVKRVRRQPRLMRGFFQGAKL